MKRHFYLALLTIFLIINPIFTAFSQGGSQYNLYSDWTKLSLTGKNQEEIEFYFRGSGEQAILKVKKRLRRSVIQNLKRMGIQRLIQRSQDQDDLNAIREKILTEIRFSGLQNDKEIIMSVKEEFGIRVEAL